MRMTETQLQDAVIQAAQTFGWTVAHFRSVRVQRKNGSTYYETPVAADGKGFPDLVLVRDRVVFAELKDAKNSLEDDQERWRGVLVDAHAEWHLWRPDDWTSGAIEECLRRRDRVEF